MLARLYFLPLLLFVAGCASWSTDPALEALPAPSHPEDAKLLPKSADDPIEPLNRGFFALDTTLFNYALEPAWSGYNKVVPEKARKGIKHFGANLGYPIRLTANLLQGEWSNAGKETKRFLINTTVGVLGFSDPATDKYNIVFPEEDLGQALGKWGWNESIYLHVPVLGASSPRDVIGFAGGIYINPSSWVYGAGAALKFNAKSFDAKTTRRLLDTEFDPYALNKLYYSRKRAVEIANSKPIMDGEDTPQTQTLMADFFRPQNKDFGERADQINIQPEGFRKSLPASVWMQEDPAPIAFVIPGLGGHRLSSRVMALAELAYLEGYHVVCFSNNLNWEFIQAAPPGYLPGYLNDDLKYLRQAHTAIISKIGKQAAGSPTVMGFSMGGWYTLNLAATAPAGTYSYALAINPPLNLNKGLDVLDGLLRRPAQLPNLEAIKESALIKLLMFLQFPPEGGSTLPFSNHEASYVIGLTYRFTLSQTIMASLGIKPSAKAHEKVGTLGWRDYYSKIVAPALNKRNIKDAALTESGNLREREAGLRNKANVKVVLTGNDFLLTEDDLAWFRERFPGKRTIFTETGGHMGQLWKPEIYNAMRAAVRFKKADFPAE